MSGWAWTSSISVVADSLVSLDVYSPPKARPVAASRATVRMDLALFMAST